MRPPPHTTWNFTNKKRCVPIAKGMIAEFQQQPHPPSHRHFFLVFMVESEFCVSKLFS
jgi:hypothetical protein